MNTELSIHKTRMNSFIKTTLQWHHQKISLQNLPLSSNIQAIEKFREVKSQLTVILLLTNTPL